MWLGLLVAVVYGAVAVAANFVNKYAVKVFPMPTTILLIQTLTAIAILRLMAALNVVRLPPLRAVRVQQLAPLSACYAVHAVLVLYSLAFLSVPMYNVLKRLTPVMVLIAKGFLDRRWPDGQTTGSVLLIVSGCLVAGVGDLSFDGQGYVLAMVCALTQATYILLAERASGGGGSAGTPRRKHHASGTDLPDIESKRGGGGGGGGSGLDSLGGPDPYLQGGLEKKQPIAHSTGVEVRANLHLSVHAASSRSISSAMAATAPAAGGSGMMSPAGGGAGGLADCSPSSGAGATASGKGGGGGGGALPALLTRFAALVRVCLCCGLGGSGGGGAEGGGGGGPASATELLYSICVIAVPGLAAGCVLTGEGARAPAALERLRGDLGRSGFAAWLLTTAVTEGLLTGSVILCTQLNSALTTSIVGVLKGAVSSVLGFFLLGGVKFHAVNVAGIAMNMVGGIWYSGVQYVRHNKGSG